MWKLFPNSTAKPRIYSLVNKDFSRLIIENRGKTLRNLFKNSKEEIGSLMNSFSQLPALLAEEVPTLNCSISLNFIEKEFRAYLFSKNLAISDFLKLFLRFDSLTLGLWHGSGIYESSKGVELSKTLAVFFLSNRIVNELLLFFFASSSLKQVKCAIPVFFSYTLSSSYKSNISLRVSI